MNKRRGIVGLAALVGCAFSLPLAGGKERMKGASDQEPRTEESLKEVRSPEPEAGLGMLLTGVVLVEGGLVVAAQAARARRAASVQPHPEVGELVFPAEQEPAMSRRSLRGARAEQLPDGPASSLVLPGQLEDLRSQWNPCLEELSQIENRYHRLLVSINEQELTSRRQARANQDAYDAPLEETDGNINLIFRGKKEKAKDKYGHAIQAWSQRAKRQLREGSLSLAYLAAQAPPSSCPGTKEALTEAYQAYRSRCIAEHLQRLAKEQPAVDRLANLLAEQLNEAREAYMMLFAPKGRLNSGEMIDFWKTLYAKNRSKAYQQELKSMGLVSPRLQEDQWLSSTERGAQALARFEERTRWGEGIYASFRQGLVAQAG